VALAHRQRSELPDTPAQPRALDDGPVIVNASGMVKASETTQRAAVDKAPPPIRTRQIAPKITRSLLRFDAFAREAG
jgi:hypothetical protein